MKAEHGGARVALASLLLRAKQEPVAAEQLLRDALRSNPLDVAAVLSLIAVIFRAIAAGEILAVAAQGFSCVLVKA